MERTAEESSNVVRRIEFPVDWPPGHVAAYLVEAEEPILIDAGRPGDAAADLRNGLAVHGYEISDIEHLVLTHAHPDHTGQAPVIYEEADPTVYAPDLVEDRLGRDLDDVEAAVRQNTTEAGTAPENMDTAIEWALQSISFSRHLLPEEQVDVQVEAGNPFEVAGIEFDPIHTPGHNAEHHVYLADVDGERTAFSGDMAIQTFRPVLMHRGLDDGVRDAIPAFETALSRLDERDVDRVYPGHGPIHAEFHEAVEQSRESLDRLLKTTHEFLKEGATSGGDPDTAVGIARDRMGEDDARSLGYMLPETVGALAHLERTGQATSDLVEGVRRYEVR